ncbi:MAG: hypothetical protein QXY11_05560 [Desulfurococcaceae archaeon]
MEHVFNAVYTVLGGLTAGLVRWFLLSQGGEFPREHLVFKLRG